MCAKKAKVFLMTSISTNIHGGFMQFSKTSNFDQRMKSLRPQAANGFKAFPV